MREVYGLVRRVAPTELPVVVVGETGTGKELVARAVHTLSAHPAGPFVAVNCAAIPETLAEAELFGWERGAFTGAVARRRGAVERAAGGTLFLDETDSLSLAIQAKLLRVLEGHGFERVGGEAVLRPAFRLVAALAAAPAVLVARGVLREDFGFRVAGVSVTLPPLRDRGADIARLARHFLATANRNGHPPKVLSTDAVAVLGRHAWPGNVRELKTLMERMAALANGPVIEAAYLAGALGGVKHDRADAGSLRAHLESCDWNVSQAARTLGVPRPTLQRWLRALGIPPQGRAGRPKHPPTEGARGYRESAHGHFESAHGHFPAGERFA